MKRIICLLLTVAMLLGCFAACGGDAGSSEPSKTESSKQETSSGGDESSEATEPEGGETGAKDPIEFSLFVDMTWFWFDKWGTEPVSQKITETTGVSFDVTRASDDQQLALLIAADDLPDIVYTDSTSRIALLCDPNVCWSYNELIEQTGVDIHATEGEIENNTRTDGNYYALLNAYTSQEAIDEGNTLLSGGCNSIAYRTDIYEAIGSPKLDTLEDLENALLAAKEKYPNVVPILNGDGGYLGYFAQQLGVKGSVGSVGYDKDGSPCYWLGMEKVDEYYKLLNRFAREGLLSPEAMTYNHDKFCEVRNAGNSFMQVRATDEAQSSNNAAILAGTDYRWKLLTHELNEDALVSVNTGIGWAGTFITKKNKDPQRAIDFMSWARSEDGRKLCSWGIQGEHWDYNENGETVTTPEYQEALTSGKQKQDDFGIAVWIFGDQGDENAFIDHAVTDPDMQDYYARLQSAVKHSTVMSELYFCIPTEGDMLNTYNSLIDMVKSEEQKVIFAETEEDFQKALDDLYAQAESMGMSKLNEWMVQQLEARK